MRLCALLAILLSGCSASAPSTDRRIPSYRRFTCTAVYAVEGDLLLATCADKLERLRLIGIDAPEIESSRKAKRDAKKSGRSLAAELARGSKAANYVRGLVHEGDRIALVFDKRQRDEEKHLLAYVYLPDGGMLNARILETGYAVPSPVPPNTRYKKLFNELYRRAKKVGRGLWRK
ncbi:MAG: thermonuclease family protein [Elusimicrobiota bacterium]